MFTASERETRDSRLKKKKKEENRTSENPRERRERAGTRDPGPGTRAVAPLERLPPLYPERATAPAGGKHTKRAKTKERRLGIQRKSGKTVSKRVPAWAKRDALILRLRGRSHRDQVEGIVEEREQVEGQLERGEGG